MSIIFISYLFYVYFIIYLVGCGGTWSVLLGLPMLPGYIAGDIFIIGRNPHRWKLKINFLNIFFIFYIFFYFYLFLWIFFISIFWYVWWEQWWLLHLAENWHLSSVFFMTSIYIFGVIILVDWGPSPFLVASFLWYITLTCMSSELLQLCVSLLCITEIDMFDESSDGYST